MDDDLKLKSHDNFEKGTISIEISKIDIHARTEKQATIYLHELIKRALDTVVMQQYENLQRVVDQVIFSQDTKKLIEEMIREKISKELDQQINDMFGKDQK